MKRGTLDHPKFRRLEKALGLPRYQAAGLLECLWHFTAIYADDGDLTRFSAEDMCDWLGWDREPTVLMAALADGWIDTTPDGKLMVHHWRDHADHAIQERWRQREKRAKTPQPLPTTPGLLPTVANTFSIQSQSQSQSQSQRNTPKPPKVANVNFVPPTVEEAKAYCAERKNGIDAEYFVSHYAKTGWVDNNGNKIKNWKACIVTWEKRNKARQPELSTDPLQADREKRGRGNW